MGGSNTCIIHSSWMTVIDYLSTFHPMVTWGSTLPAARRSPPAPAPTPVILRKRSTLRKLGAKDG